MTEAEFERRQQLTAVAAVPVVPGPESELTEPILPAESDVAVRPNPARSRAARSKPAKPRRVQRMFALDEELDKKLWLYAIHVGKDRSEVVNDVLRPLVASMVLYDSRDRRAVRAIDIEGEVSA
jgi:hypothetical protein